MKKCFIMSLVVSCFLNELLDQYKQEAVSAQLNHQPLAVRNGWYKYVCLKELDSREGVADVKKWLEETDQTLWPPPAPVVVPAAAPAPIHKSMESPRVSPENLVKQAEMLKTNGQLDEALRYYRLAGQSAPESADIKKRIEDLEKEMN